MHHPSGDQNDPGERWALTLQDTEIKMLCGQSVEGRDEAIAGEQYFASKQRLDSEPIFDLADRRGFDTLVDHQAKERYARKAIDILSALEHNCGPEVLPYPYIFRS